MKKELMTTETRKEKKAMPVRTDSRVKPPTNNRNARRKENRNNT